MGFIQSEKNLGQDHRPVYELTKGLQTVYDLNDLKIVLTAFVAVRKGICDQACLS